MKWVQFNDNAAEIVKIAESSVFCDQIVRRVDAINKRWKQLEENIHQRLEQIELVISQVSQLDRLHHDVTLDLKVS